MKNKPFKIASDPKYDGNEGGLASMVYKFFDKKCASHNKYLECWFSWYTITEQI